MLFRTKKCKKSSSHWGCAYLEANLKTFQTSLCILCALFYEKCETLVYCVNVRGWDAMLLVRDFWFQYCRDAKNRIQRYCVPWQSIGFLPHAFMKWLDLDLLKFRLRLLWSWQGMCVFVSSPHCKCGVTLAFSWLFCIVYLPLYLRLKFCLTKFQGFCLMLHFSTGSPSWTFFLFVCFFPYSAWYVRGSLFPSKILVLRY